MVEYAVIPAHKIGKHGLDTFLNWLFSPSTHSKKYSKHSMDCRNMIELSYNGDIQFCEGLHITHTETQLNDVII